MIDRSILGKERRSNECHKSKTLTLECHETFHLDRGLRVLFIIDKIKFISLR